MAENWFDAARQGQFNRLCSLSASCIKSRDSSGNTALMLVVQSGHTECLKLLEEEATMTNNSGLTALAIAIMCGNNTACAFLAPMEAHSFAVKALHADAGSKVGKLRCGELCGPLCTRGD